MSFLEMVLVLPFVYILHLTLLCYRYHLTVTAGDDEIWAMGQVRHVASRPLVGELSTPSIRDLSSNCIPWAAHVFGMCCMLGK